MRQVFKILLTVSGLAYPLVVWFFAERIGWNWLIALTLALVLARVFFLAKSSQAWRDFVPLLLMVVVIVALARFSSQSAVLSYPALMSFGLAGLFAYSLRFPPSAIERIAKLSEGTLSDHAILYTRKVTKVWLGFFVFNGLIASYTIWLGDIAVWTFYNGLLSYVLAGVLFLAEYLVRRKVKQADRT